MKTKKEVRLNLGCGRDYKKGYINVDVVTDFPVDVIADLSKPLPFKSNYADEILASDILEHFTKEDGEIFLQECYRVLKVGGVLILRTHNIEQIIKQFYDDSFVMRHFIYGNTEKTGVWGAHKYAYEEQELNSLLNYMGFTGITISHEETNFYIIAKKSIKEEKKLTVGIIHQTPGLGGAETNIKNLTEYFIKQKQKVLFATNFFPLEKQIKKTNASVVHIPYILDVIGNWKGLVKSMLLFLPALVFYSRLLHTWKKKGVSCLLMSGFSEKMLVSVLALFFNIPVFWIEYADLRPVFKQNLGLPYLLYRFCNLIPRKVIVPGDYTKQMLIQYAKVPLSKQIVIPPGVLRTNTRKRDHAGFHIGNVSRLVPEKGQDVLIKAMASVVKKIPDAHLSIVGEGMNPVIYQELINMLGLEKHITLLGFVSSLDEFYSNLDVFVFPTIWILEGFGMVATEAMEKKVPVIVSDLGTLPEIVDYGNAGILVPPGDSKAIADAIIRLHKDQKHRKYLGEKGYEQVIGNYTIDVTGKAFLDVFQRNLI